MVEEKKQDEAKSKDTVARAEKKSDVQLSKKMIDIISSIEGMTVLELSSLIKALEEKFGVTATQAAVAVTGGVGVATAIGVAAVAEEKTSFAVILANAGTNKIQVIKEIRAITTLGLKEAKDLVESAPKTIKEDAPKAEAEEIKKRLEGAGAKVELK